MKHVILSMASMCAVCILTACGDGSVGAKNQGKNGSQAAIHLSLKAPSTVSTGAPFTFSVVALDSSDNIDVSYSGTVHISSTDLQAMLPKDSTLTNGTQAFSVTLESPGTQTISAIDTVTAGITGSSNPIQVAIGSTPKLFQPTGNMASQRAGHSSTLLSNGKVLIAGGYNGTGVLATAELFDPDTGTFSPTGSMTSARYLHTATLLTNGKVLITGGAFDLNAGVDDSGDLATAELFDPDSGTFTATGKMSEVRSEHTATLLADGKVLVVGGNADNVAELFDPGTATFSPTAGKLNTGGRWGCTATSLIDGRVLIAGGRDEENVWDAISLNDAEVFDPATGNFTITGSMTEFRYDHTATLLNNGKVLITGGLNGQPLPSAELFDPAGGSFSGTGRMGSPRTEHTATLLDDGTVLVAGGLTYAAPGSFSSAEIFDPVMNVFAPTSSMAAGRFSHAATRLDSGLVLITGGQSTITIPEVFTSSADLYD